MGADFTFLKGNIETIILSALYENDKYGYELAREIKEKTSNKYEIKQPTLYAYLRRLEEDDLIVSYWGESSNGGRRRYYKITKSGKENYERFMSEWTFQKSVLDDLVDSDAATTDVKQSDVTPLFGRKSSKRKTKNTLKSSLDEQDEIARKLSELVSAKQGGDDGKNIDGISTEDKDIVNIIEDTPSDDVVEVKESTVVEEKNLKEESKTPVVVNDKSRFDVKQENADVFIKAFDERAREASKRDVVSHDEGENYQHVLLNVIGDQLDNVDNPSDASSAHSTYYEGAPTGLEEVADNFAKEGIRVRIYNHATAVYKSKMLIPLARVLCQTAWIAYAIAFIYYGILALTFNWQPFIITLGALLLVPIAFSIHAIIDPTRKDKPPFNFKIAIIVSAVVALIIILCAVGFSALDGRVFSDPQAVSVKILIPVGIAILLPAAISIYYFIYKKY